MKTVFIINPKAGKEKDIKMLTRDIYDTADFLKADVECYVTKCQGDAVKFVKEYLKTNGCARFISCGGDGTLNEVLNGCIGEPGAQVGVMPMGTGNDFVRNFDSGCDFLNIAAQILGETEKCDAIRYQTSFNGEEKAGYCVNMFNIGFDCNVADTKGKIIEKSFIAGPLAYFAAIILMLIKKKGAKLKIELDGNEKYKGSLLLCSIANGSFCGGGIKSNPMAHLRDGLMDVNIIHNISRLNFISKLPFYMKGTHVKLRGIERIIENHSCKKAALTPLDGSMRLCIDGEIIDASLCEFETEKNAFNLVIPRTAETDILEKDAEKICCK